VKTVSIDPTEMESRRFKKLCARLEISGSGRYRVYGHLMAFFGEWARENTTDAGLLRGDSVVDVGALADWDEPRKFGEALRAAGYVARLEDMFPAELCGHDGGFVVLNRDGFPVLEDSWRGWHSRRSFEQAVDLFRYLRVERRWEFVLAKGVDLAELAAKGHVPEAWVGQYEAWRASQFEGEESECGASGDGMRRISRPNRNRKGRDDSSLVTLVVDQSSGREGSRVGFASPPHEGNEGNRTEGKGNEGGQRTGKAKSAELREFVAARCNVHGALDALYEIDDGPAACRVWEGVFEAHPDFVVGQLAEISQPANWRKVRNPGAVLMKNLKPHFAALPRRDGAGRRRRGGEAKPTRERGAVVESPG